MSAGLLLLLGLYLPPTYAGPVADNELEAWLDRCIQASVQEGNGTLETDAVVDLGQRCPGLWTRVHASSLAALLEPGSPSMTLGGLLDLRAMVRTNRAFDPPSSLDPGAIPAVLAQAWRHTPEAAEQGWWQRFKAWLREYFGTSDELDVPAWLEDWLRSWKPSTGVLETLLWSLTAVVLVLVAAVVVTELRAAGRFPRRPRVEVETDAPGQASDPAMGFRPGTLEDIDDLPPGRRAVALMNILLGLLREWGWLPPDESRTNRELLAMLPPVHQAESLLLRRVLEQGEAWLYGGRTPQDGVLRPLLEEVRRLARRQPPAHSPPNWPPARSMEPR